MVATTRNRGVIDAVADIPRIAQFIDADEELIKNIHKHRDDTDSIREYIKQKAKEPFVVQLMDYSGPSPYSSDSFVDKLAQHLIDESGMIDELMMRDLGVKPRVPKIDKKPKIKPWKKEIKVGKGKGAYNKGYKKWTVKEEIFISRRKDLKPKQVTSEFSTHFGYARSKSSIQTKKSRLKRTKF